MWTGPGRLGAAWTQLVSVGLRQKGAARESSPSAHTGTPSLAFLAFERSMHTCPLYPVGARRARRMDFERVVVEGLMILRRVGGGKVCVRACTAWHVYLLFHAHVQACTYNTHACLISMCMVHAWTVIRLYAQFMQRGIYDMCARCVWCVLCVHGMCCEYLASVYCMCMLCVHCMCIVTHACTLAWSTYTNMYVP